MQLAYVALRLTVMTLGIAVAIAAVWYGWHWLESFGSEPTAQTPSGVAINEELVVLTPNKLKAAELQVAQAEVRPLARAVTLMGRIDYDRTRFLAINAFDDLVVEQMPFQVGEPVEAEQTVLVAQCPALGKTRAEVIRQDAVCELTRLERDRTQQIHAGLQRLLAYVEQDMEVKQVQQQIVQESLGPYRQQVIDAYSDASLAKSLLDQGQQAVEQGALAGRSLQERQAAWQSAQSRLLSVCEESRFEVSQDLGKIQSQLAEQEARLAIDLEYLKYLTGESRIDIDTLRALPKEKLGRWEIKSPRSGVVVQLPVALGARLQHEDRLIELADPSQVWVRAWWRPSAGNVITIKAGTTGNGVSSGIRGWNGAGHGDLHGSRI